MRICGHTLFAHPEDMNTDTKPKSNRYDIFLTLEIDLNHPLFVFDRSPGWCQQGGAMYIYSATVSVSHTTFDGNTAVGGFRQINQVCSNHPWHTRLRQTLHTAHRDIIPPTNLFPHTTCNLPASFGRHVPSVAACMAGRSSTIGWT